MDNMHRISAITLYEDGWRAYFHTGCGGQVYFKDGLLHHNVLNTINSCAVWEALRAYQDAERKKGVLITMSDEKREFWYLRDYDFIHEDGTVEKYTFDSVEGQPVINVDWNFLLTGQFTNFRWRAGYPKGGQNG